MNSRMVSLLGALAALAVIIMLLTPAKNPAQKSPSFPHTEDSGAYGLKAFKRWLDESNIPNESFRERFDSLLSHDGLATTGNLLITHAPNSVPHRRNELLQLQFWIERGNSLLLLIGAADTPPWLFHSSMRDEDILNALGWEFTFAEDDSEAGDEDNEDIEEQDIPEKSLSESLRDMAKAIDQMEHRDYTLNSHISHPLTRSAQQLTTTHVPLLHPRLKLKSSSERRTSLVLYRDEQDTPALWKSPAHKGTLYISSYSSLIANQYIRNPGNAQLALNIINHALSPNGKVLFDDMHFGLSNLYDPDAFFGDTRLHNTIWFIFLFWLIYVVGHSNRLAPPSPAANIISAVDFAMAVGGFFARKVDNKSAALALFEHFFNEVRANHKLPRNGQPVWDVLQFSPRLGKGELQFLQQWYESLPHKRKHNLMRLRNHLLDCKDKLA